MLKLRLLLSILILAGLAVIGYSRSQVAKGNTANQCAIRYEPDDFVMVDGERIMNSKVVDRECFETPAELMRWATDGAVDLPNDASQQEVDEAYQAYYENLKASENKSE